MTDMELRNVISRTMTCRIDKRSSTSYLFDFLSCDSFFFSLLIMSCILVLINTFYIGKIVRKR